MSTTIEDLLPDPAEVTAVLLDEHTRREAWQHGYDDYSAGSNIRWREYEGTPLAKPYNDGFIQATFDRMSVQSARLALVLHPVGRKYKARHRRVAS